MGCREFFEANQNEAQKCKVLQAQEEHLNLAWELEKASAHSPAPVDSTENLIRYWFNPAHIDPETGTLKPTAFDDASSRGLSVNRLAHTKMETIAALATGRAEEWNSSNAHKPPRALFGYSDFSASEVRAIVTQAAGRAFAVYDTANSTDSSHADVCQIVPSEQGGRSARSQIRALANSRLKKF